MEPETSTENEINPAETAPETESAPSETSTETAPVDAAPVVSKKLTPDEVKHLRGKLDFMKKTAKRYADERKTLEDAGKTSHHKANIYADDIKALETQLKDY